MEKIDLNRKGILMAGGSGSRLMPITCSVSKQLLPVGDKPLIFYSLSILLLAGIREIAIVCQPCHRENFYRLLGDGSIFGIDIRYIVQEKPGGIAQGILLAEDFIGSDPLTLMLGDNIFYGIGLTGLLRSIPAENSGATIFAHRVSDPERFGVAEFDEAGLIRSIEEKPKVARSNYALTGLYFYDNRALDFAKRLRPSERGELEITDLNKRYLEIGELAVKKFGRGFAWLDTGTHQSLVAATNFVNTIESQQAIKIACLEEIAFDQGWISVDELECQAERFSNSSYGEYLRTLINRVQNESY